MSGFADQAIFYACAQFLTMKMRTQNYLKTSRLLGNPLNAAAVIFGQDWI